MENLRRQHRAKDFLRHEPQLGEKANVERQIMTNDSNRGQRFEQRLDGLSRVLEGEQIDDDDTVRRGELQQTNAVGIGIQPRRLGVEADDDTLNRDSFGEFVNCVSISDERETRCCRGIGRRR